MYDDINISNIFNQAVLDSIPANIAVIDNDSNIIAVNKTWQDFPGKAGADEAPRCIGLNYLDICRQAKESDSSVDLVINGIKELLNGQRNIFVHEYPCPVPGGEELWFSLRAAPLKYKNIQQGAVIFHFDITERKKSEKALKKSEEKFRSYVENANDIIFTIDEKGLFIYISPNCQNILGYSQKEVIGKNFKRFTHSEDIQKLDKKLGEKIKENKLLSESDLSNSNSNPNIYGNESIEYRVWNKNGELKWLSVKTSLINVQKSKFELLGIARDITEEKQMEEELDKYYEELEILYEKLDEEVNKAKEIHEKTLPKSFPTFENISLDSFYKPAEIISGDYYNILKKGNKLIIYYSDVTGHGLDSAMLSAFVKNTIDTYISLYGEDTEPAKLLEFLAKQYREENYPDDFFVCLYIGILDTKTCELKYTSGGMHELPRISFESGEKITLKNTDLPISSAIPPDKYNFDTKTQQLTPGATILFTTDGLTEQRIGDQHYRERLDKMFNKNCVLPPTAIVELIKNDFVEFNMYSTKTDDDVTLIVMQIDPENRKHFTYIIDSDLSEIDYLIQLISPKFPYLEKKQDMLIAIHELVVNAVEHGNDLNPEKKVKVEIILDEKYMMTTVEDEGDGFDWEKRLHKDLNLNGSSERGRGINITHIASDKLFYNYRGNKAFAIFFL